MSPFTRGFLVATAQYAVLLIAGLSWDVAVVALLALIVVGLGERHLLATPSG